MSITIRRQNVPESKTDPRILGCIVTRKVIGLTGVS